MTKRLFWEDAYLKEFDATVINVNGNEVTLDQTTFYPTGGGQLNDTGIITGNGQEYKVTDVKKNADEIIHVVDKAGLQVRDKVKGKIDWERRYALMRHHTAVHVMGAIVLKKYKGPATGGMLYPDKGHMDFDCPELNRDLAAKVIEESNNVIAENHNVYSRFMSKEEMEKYPDLVRTETGKELVQGLDKIRTVEIENFDIQSDGGTHVNNTKEIGRMKLTGFDNKGKHRKRIEFALEL